MTSTRDLSRLPDVETLRRAMQSAALLDAILCPEWESRYFSFNAAWGAGEQMGSTRNGSGDDLFAHFSAAGAWVKGFAHESPMSPYRDGATGRAWPGILDAVPDAFSGCLSEPAFQIGDVTFCIWRGERDRAWQVGPVQFPPDHSDPDGSEFLLSLLDGSPETYRAWATEYYERTVPLAAVEHVFRHFPLTPDVIHRLDPSMSLEALAADLAEIGYASR